MPPQAAFKGFLTTTPEALTFVQLIIGGCQIISLMIGDFGGCMLIFSDFKITNYVIFTAAIFVVLFPERAVFEIMRLILISI